MTAKEFRAQQEKKKSKGRKAGLSAKKRTPNYGPFHLDPEELLQANCVDWFKKNLKGMDIMHVPNHGTKAKKRILGIIGQWAGASDLVIDEPAHGYRALYIELKVKSPVSDNQWKFLRHKAKKGNQCFVCWNLETFKAIVIGYFRGDYTFLHSNNLKLKHVKHE